VSGGFGFSDIKPGTAAPRNVNQNEVDRTAEAQGFVSREVSTIIRKAKLGPNGPVGQFNLRAAVADINEFVEWCGRERLSYREGFGKLMELWRQSDLARQD
jgi:hypothetical protein